VKSMTLPLGALSLGAALFLVTPACAQNASSASQQTQSTQATAPASGAKEKQPTLREHCEDLAKQFKAADTSHVAPDKLAAAQKQAAHGEKLCAKRPKKGIKALNLAFKDIGVTPK
ncbi:MAG: hypothetical protein KGO02_21705, partial [Alphaproteobacteria bacterium]|nr:hypothetical protein [Alphaproteobacteria bacterium]